MCAHTHMKKEWILFRRVNAPRQKMHLNIHTLSVSIYNNSIIFFGSLIRFSHTSHHSFWTKREAFLWNTRIHDIVSRTGWMRASSWSGLKTRNGLIYIDGGFLFDMRSLYFTIKLSTQRTGETNTPEYGIVFAHACKCVCMRVRTSKNTRQKERSREPKFT